MKPSKPQDKRSKKTTIVSLISEEQAFAEVMGLIQAARGRAFAAVNTALIELYWQVGEYISRKLETAAWGEGVVNELASYIQRSHPNLRGFTRRNLFRMRQFFEAYRAHEKVSALLAPLLWTHHLLILGHSKRAEEREFYIRVAAQEKWSSRELERQLKACLFERAVLNPPRVSTALRQLHPGAETIFRDAYLVEFLELPEGHLEAASRDRRLFETGRRAPVRILQSGRQTHQGAFHPSGDPTQGSRRNGPPHGVSSCARS